MIKSKQKHSKAGLKENSRKQADKVVKVLTGIKMIAKVRDYKG
jgi:hypothetical protein